MLEATPAATFGFCDAGGVEDVDGVAEHWQPETVAGGVDSTEVEGGVEDPGVLNSEEPPFPSEPSSVLEDMFIFPWAPKVG